MKEISDSLCIPETPRMWCTKGGIRKHRDRNTWQVYFPWHGKTIWINQYFDRTPLYSEKQANRVLEHIRAEYDHGTFDPASYGKDKTLLFENAWRLYADESQVSPGRAESREMIYERYLESYWQDFSLRDIEEPHIAKWFSGLPSEIAPSYRRLIKVTLKAFFNHFTVTRRKLFKFPAVKVPKKAVAWLTKEDQEKVLEFISPHYQGMIRFIMAYGCRPSEACSLKKSDLDWQQETIIFRNRKNSQDNTLPLMPEIKAILTAPRKLEHFEYVFCGSWGGKVNPQPLSEIWQRANRKANEKYGVKVVPLKNGTRHSLASQLRSRGVGLSDIARILGNTEAVCEQSYGRVSVGRVAEVMTFKRLSDDRKEDAHG